MVGDAGDAEPPHELDRAQFSRELTLTALRLPKQLCHRYVRLLKGALLSLPRTKAILTDPADPDKRLVLLKEGIQDAGAIEKPANLAEQLRSDGVETTTHTLHLDYTHLTLEEVLRRFLPEGCEIPGSFETVGHIAHLNLREESLPYKRLIGQVVLDKNPGIKTVVNKVGSIENEFRVLPMEVIAGEDRLEATVKQHSARFRLHFAEVYWNSRLEREHQRLVEQFAPGEVIADVMAGIGPFAVPAAQRGNEVWANDLNPRSCHYLRENIALNKVQAKVKAFQLDGREFIRRMAGSGAQPSAHASDGAEVAGRAEAAGAGAAAEIPPSGVRFHHAVMNLPASAVEFLDAFAGAFSREAWRGRPLPLLHVYTFARADESERDVIARVEGHLGGPLDEAARVHLVRDVSPNKRMLCVSFRLPGAVAFGEDAGESARKKQRTEPAT